VVPKPFWLHLGFKTFLGLQRLQNIFWSEDNFCHEIVRTNPKASLKQQQTVQSSPLFSPNWSEILELELYKFGELVFCNFKVGILHSNYRLQQGSLVCTV